MAVKTKINVPISGTMTTVHPETEPDQVVGLSTTYAKLASPTFTGTPKAPTASTSTNTTQIATTAYVKSNLSSYAPKASPALTGTPTAPTAPEGTNTTQIATTAFVNKAIGGDSVVDTYVNTSTGDWYRVFKSGWVEQGGRTQQTLNTATITLLKPYSNTTYSVSLVKVRPTMTAGGGSDLIPAINGSRSTTGFTITQHGSSGSTYYGHYTLWSAQGQGVAP